MIGIVESSIVDVVPSSLSRIVESISVGTGTSSFSSTIGEVSSSFKVVSA